MIRIKHYSHDYDSVNPCPLVLDFGDSNTDTSKWRPDISIARVQAGMSSGKKFLYDFPDGVDNGEVVQTFIRSPGLDITEVDSARMRVTQIIEDKTKNDEKSSASSKEKKQFLDNIQKLADSATDSSTTETESIE